MDYPQDEEYVVCHDEQRAPEAEDDSLFGMIPSDLLYWMFHRWDPAMRASVVMVCHRWHRVGSAAFNVFRTNKAFLHGLFLDSKHLRSLLSDPRLPRQYLEDPSILSVMFGRVSEYAVLVDLAARAVLTDDMWLTCFEEAVRTSNTAAVECLLLHPMSEAGSRSINTVAKIAMNKQDAITLHAVCKRYANQLYPMFGAVVVTRWCCEHGKAVTLAELLRVPAYCNVQNVVTVLRYALINHVEPLVFAVWDKEILSARQSGRSTLLKACAHNWVRVACLLMRQGMQPEDRGWNNALTTAATYGHVDILKLLCSDARCNPGTSHNRVVRQALMHQQVEAAAFLLAHPRVNPDDDGGDVNRNLLCDIIAADHPVTHEDKARLVQILLDRKADPNCHEHGAVRLALAHKCFPVLAALVKCPRTLVTRKEFYAVLDAIPRSETHRCVIQELLQSPRFQEHFV